MNTYLFQLINSWAGQNVWLDRLMIFSADTLGYLLIIFVLGAFLIDRNKYRNMAIVAIGSAIVARFVFVTIIRFFYHHLRPFDVLSDVHLIVDRGSNEYSFPSGHASFYFALAAGVYFYNKKAGLACFAASGLIGFARIFVGVHWPFDILAGAVLGVVTAVMCKKLWQRYKDRLIKA